MTEVAELLRVSKATAYRLVQAGELPALRVGHQLRVDPRELDQWLYGRANREDSHATG